MKRAHRSSLFGFVITGAIVAACGGATSSSEPADAGVDAEVAPDTSVPEVPALDSAPSDPPMPDADTKDAAGDARDPGDAVVDAADPGDAMVDAADASVDPTSDAGTLPPALFMPGESGALYEMRAVCKIEAAERSHGLINGCCAFNGAEVTTTCETMLREEPDGAGSLRVVIDPLQGCTTVQTTPVCRISRNNRYDPAYNCSCNAVNATLGRPITAGVPNFRNPRVDGAYARRLMRVGTSTVPVSHYWIPGCATESRIGQPDWDSCSRADTFSEGYILTTLERTGDGEFTLRRTWDIPFGTPRPYCLGPDVVAPLTLRHSGFSTGAGASAGSNFNVQRFRCTYTLTKK